MLIKRSGRRAVGIIDRHGDLGGVASRPGVAAGKDHVVHVDGAHGFMGGLSHYPAQSLDEIGLAAAIGADDARQARLDQKIRGLDKGLKADEPQAR